jgi:beta-glucanase (GH16 family)
LSVTVVGHTAAGAIDFVVDGRRWRRTHRRSVRLTPGTGHGLRWRNLEVRRAGSGRLLGAARFAIGSSSSRRAPTLVLLDGPSAQISTTTAVLRFSVTPRAKTSCALDGARFRQCANPASFSDLSAGRHTFTVRALGAHGRAGATVASTVAASSTGPSPGTDSTSGPPATDAAGRHLVFDDEFDGNTLETSKWSPYYSAGNGGNGLRRPSALTLDGHGNLVVTAQMVSGQIVSGGMSTKPHFTYGRFETRVRTDIDPTGTMSGVVLAWPQSGRWPEDGELDIYETGAAANTRTPFYSFVHYGASNQQYYFAHNADGAQWHTLAMEWSAGAIQIFRDGALVWTVTDNAAIPDVAHLLTVQLDAIATRSLSGPVTMDVDYVRVYQ